MRLLLFATSCKETQSVLQGGKWKNTFHAYPAQMAFPMGVVWTMQPNWSHHPRYPLPEVRVAAPSVEGDFRDALQQHWNDVLRVAMCVSQLGATQSGVYSGNAIMWGIDHNRNFASSYISPHRRIICLSELL